MYVKLTSDNEVEQYPYTLGDLRRDNKNVSFPRQVGANTLAEYRVYPVVVADPPAYDPFTQTAQEGTPALVSGQWKVDWVVTSLPTNDAVNNVRNHRNDLLEETDWMAGSDVTMPNTWREYRQALRDLPAQSGFPNVTWPTEPS